MADDLNRRFGRYGFAGLLLLIIAAGMWTVSETVALLVFVAAMLAFVVVAVTYVCIKLKARR